MSEKIKSIFNDTKNFGLYVHIPFCKRKCSYCNFYSEPVDKYDTNRFIKAVRKELLQVNTDFVKTIYIGGGSPSSLPLSQLKELIEKINRRCHDIIEFTIECNPGQINPDMLKVVRDLGVNRLSIGAQSFNDKELQFLGRIHNCESITIAVEQARKIGFNNISLDLIFAICGSSQESWQESLDKAIALNPEHISAYSLTIESDTPLAQAIENGEIIEIDEIIDRAMYEQAICVLEKNGYKQYEISNFAKPGYECKHNLGYWQNLSYIGIGPSASSSNSKERTRNISDINAYVDAIENNQSSLEETIIISDTDRIYETAVLNLRTRYGIDITRFKQDTGKDPNFLFAEPIRIYCEQGLLAIENNRIFLTKKALPVADSILCDFASL